MVKIFENVLTKNEVSQLLDYHFTKDNRTDDRPDVTSKHPRWDIDCFPQSIIKKLLDQVLDYEYTVEEIIFNQSRISFRLHTDSGNGDVADTGNVIVVPLQIDGPSSTVFFDNHWPGPSTRFSRKQLSPFEYTLKNKDGQWTVVKDLRELLTACQTDPKSVLGFTVDSDFIKQLEYLIDARSNKKIAQVDRRCSDYSSLSNYRPDSKFDQQTHDQFLQHIDIEDLHGLTLDVVAPWTVGSCVVFPRTQLHSAGSGHTEKIGITIFTQRR